MAEPWQHQLRIDVPADVAVRLRADPDHPSLTELRSILRRHDAQAICQYDAFAGYCTEAEREGVEHFPLYAWTKATIEDPAKKAKYEKSFTPYIGGEQVYPKARADALAVELWPLVGAGLIADLHRYDTNPASNPQPPTDAGG